MSRYMLLSSHIFLFFILSNCVHSETTNDIFDQCAANLCITRCCPKNKHLYKNSCVSNRYPEENPIVYATNLKTILDVNVLGVQDLNLNLNATVPFPEATFLLKNGSLMVRKMDKSLQYIAPKDFCIGHKKRSKDALKMSVKFYTICGDKSSRSVESMTYFKIAAWLISSLFLALVLAVYALLKELRNLRGLMLMSCLASLMTAYLFLAIYITDFNVYNNRNYIIHKVCVLLTYFSLMACFFWMNTMSFDIWWTFRGFVQVRAIHRRGELCKYLVYCVYAWGVPLLMTIAVVILDEVDLSQYPWIIKPDIRNGGPWRAEKIRRYYVHMPIAPLILANVVLFVLTVKNIHHLGSGAARLHRNVKSHKNRFALYLKLSVVMGINWLLECVSPELHLEKYYIVDIYNGLIGVVIFFIFVYKDNTWKKLVARYHGEAPRSSYRSRSSGSTTDVSLFSDGEPLQVVNCDPRATSLDRQSSLRIWEKSG